MRNEFINELIVQARVNPRIVLVVGDLGYSVVEPFAEEFPDRFFNAGVAEQNMTGLAAGMASEGYHVFTYSIANFPTFRCAEQIRNDVDYHRLPVTVVSVGGGLAYGALGYSHHAVQDYALIRVMPNMLIAAPCEPLEVRACVKYLVNNPGPSYLRLGKAGGRSFHSNIGSMAPGGWLQLRDGCKNNVILLTGGCVENAMDRVKMAEFSDYSVYSVPLWSMASKVKQVEKMRNIDNLISVEDHLLDGGFGSWLLEAKTLDKTLKCSVLPIALKPQVCELVGTQRTLNRIGGI